MTQGGNDPYCRLGIAIGIVVGRVLGLFARPVRVRNWSEGMARAIKERMEPGEAANWRVPAGEPIMREIVMDGELTTWGYRELDDGHTVEVWTGPADQLGPVEQDRLIAIRATWEGRAADDH